MTFKMSKKTFWHIIKKKKNPTDFKIGCRVQGIEQRGIIVLMLLFNLMLMCSVKYLIKYIWYFN